MKNTEEYSHIVNTIAEYANVNKEDMKELCVDYTDGLYEINFYTDYMSYTCYADLSGRVVGFLSEPVPMEAEACTIALDSAQCA